VGETWACVEEEAAGQWAAVLQALWDLQPEEGDHGPRPRLLRLTACGRRAWERFTQDQAGQLNAEGFPDFLRGPWSKFRGYCARVGLILQCLRRAAGEGVGEDVDGDSIDRAAEVVGYFQAHCRRVYHALDADPQVADARRVKEWLQAHPELETFTRRDVHQGLRNCERFANPASLHGPLQTLEAYGYVRRQRPDRDKGPGRPSDRFDRNPLWTHEPCTQNPQNPQNGGF
jgi:hypothetical protein